MPTIVRLDRWRTRVAARRIEALLFAGEAVEIDRASFNSIDVFDDLAEAVERLVLAGWLAPECEFGRVVLTPDFHRGAGIPVGTVIETIGFVVPRAIGNDIGCGMGLAMLEGVTPAEIEAAGPALDQALRALYFQGGRSIRVAEADRRAILAEGAVPAAMLEDLAPPAATFGLDRTRLVDALVGAPITPGTPFAEWLAPGGRAERLHDPLLGGIGGGNHFVEIQAVTALHDGAAAWDWGIRRDQVAVMVHSGSLGLGRAVAVVHQARAEAAWPKGLGAVTGGLTPLPITGPRARLGLDYLADMAAAARFAMANRLCLSLMARQAIERALGRPIGWRLVADLPHNLIWAEDGLSLHRKGACPALGPLEGEARGRPVLVPGSMGTSSHVLVGLGSADALASAPHGAGRGTRRNAARAAAAAATPVRAIGPIDLRRARPDIARELERRLAEEAPAAYKDVGPVIDTVVGAGMAARVADMRPLVTVKG